jgi:acetyl-CoA C-acetyltransferase
VTELREAVICNPLRTPVGRYGGVLRDVPAATLGAQLVKGLIARTGLPVDAVDDLILGHGYPSGEAPAIGRVVALDAGLDTRTAGIQLDRRCGSGLQAVIYAAMQVQTGASDLAIAGGAESMSQVEYYSLDVRWGTRGGSSIMNDRLDRARISAGGCNYPVPGGMIETAENLRREYGIGREEQDQLAVESHRRATRAQQDGGFASQLVPVEINTRQGSTVVDIDEHPRSPEGMLDKLAGLRPVMVRSDPEATVTAGNASGQNDGAAACIVTTRDRADELGLVPYARLVSWATAGVGPATMGIGPIPATELALKRAGLTLADMDLIELNEAFAAQVLAVTRGWHFAEADFERLNVNGSGISLGHPVGATGARILTTLLHELRRRQARYGLETMCIGGGQGIAAVFEAV